MQPAEPQHTPVNDAWPTRVRPPAPTSVSEQASDYLNALPPSRPAADSPALDDVEGWSRWVKTTNAAICAMLGERLPPQGSFTREHVTVGGVPSFALKRSPLVDDDGPLYLDLHGGGLVLCEGDAAWMMSAKRAVKRNGTTIVPDFRNPPLHPYPAVLDDCLAVYRSVLIERSPDQVIVLGESGGANLATALLLRARDEGLPMPAALVLLTPNLDLTQSGDSFRANLGIDTLRPHVEQNLLYANGHDLADPFLSPLLGDLTGFPPTFVQSGTRDLYLSNAVRIHRKLLSVGVEAELHIFEAMPHGSFGGRAPEDEELIAEVRRFEQRHLGDH